MPLNSKLLLQIALPLLLVVPSTSFALFGEDLPALFKLIAGQVVEIERLSEQVGIEKENRKFLKDLNEGIDRTIAQIQALEELTERAQGLSPTAVRGLSDLNDYLGRVENAKRSVDEVLSFRIQAAGLAIGQSSAQSETAYLMGQEMIQTGNLLAQESKTASPGRAQQITAAGASAQMLSQGVTLQTLAQMAQLQAVQLDLQRAQIESLLQEKRQNRSFYESTLRANPIAKKTSSKDRSQL